MEGWSLRSKVRRTGVKVWPSRQSGSHECGPSLAHECHVQLGVQHVVRVVNGSQLPQTLSLKSVPHCIATLCCAGVYALHISHCDASRG